VVLWLAGADLRVTVLAVPPVLPLIHREFGLSERAIGALSGLPPLLFGLAAVPGSLMIAKLGARRAAIAALLLIAAASAARGIGPSVPMLFVMTGIMAAGWQLCSRLCRYWLPGGFRAGQALRPQSTPTDC
jgi:CP family cyanate transporter-like MFS transporter